jgi:hypothetical protein
LYKSSGSSDDVVRSGMIAKVLRAQHTARLLLLAVGWMGGEATLSRLITADRKTLTHPGFLTHLRHLPSKEGSDGQRSSACPSLAQIGVVGARLQRTWARVALNPYPVGVAWSDWPSFCIRISTFGHRRRCVDKFQIGQSFAISCNLYL